MSAGHNRAECSVVMQRSTMIESRTAPLVWAHGGSLGHMPWMCTGPSSLALRALVGAIYWNALSGTGPRVTSIQLISLVACPPTRVRSFIGNWRPSTESNSNQRTSC